MLTELPNSSQLWDKVSDEIYFFIIIYRFIEMEKKINSVTNCHTPIFDLRPYIHAPFDPE